MKRKLRFEIVQCYKCGHYSVLEIGRVLTYKASCLFKDVIPNQKYYNKNSKIQDLENISFVCEKCNEKIPEHLFIKYKYLLNRNYDFFVPVASHLISIDFKSAKNSYTTGVNLITNLSDLNKLIKKLLYSICNKINNYEQT